MDPHKMTDEQLQDAYVKAIQRHRYYHNTDDIHSWRNETAKREKNDVWLKTLEGVYELRGVKPPMV